MTHEQKTISVYAHDYRDMDMSESVLRDMLEDFVECLECDHVCTSECRRSGCNCVCGEFHF